MQKRLYRSEEGKKISGVCAGIAEYLDADATIIRLGYTALSIFTGIIFGVLVYIAAAIIIPNIVLE